MTDEILGGHGLAQYGCVHCDFVTGSKTKLEEHVREEHGADI